MKTWREKVEAEVARIGRKLTLDELLALAKDHFMTPAEVAAQRASWARSCLTDGVNGLTLHGCALRLLDLAPRIAAAEDGSAEEAKLCDERDTLLAKFRQADAMLDRALVKP
jgi:hypothetical protein